MKFCFSPTGCFATLLPLVLLASPAFGDAPQSESIAQSIQQDLRDSARMAGGEVTVAARDGHVTLSGTVNSVMDLRRAATIAKRTLGVQSVTNSIIVEPTKRTDQEIKSDVVMRLKVNDSVEKPAISARVSGGRVTLTGDADSLAEKRIAEMAAGGVDGVRSVDNQLSLRESPSRTDDEMRDEIAGLLVHSVYLDDVTPQVSVKGGVATLTGNVGSAAQRDWAEQLAEIRGIQKVDVSMMTIDPTKLDPTERERRYADVSDEKIQMAVKASLKFDPVTFHSVDAIEVAVKNGTVTLDGTTPRLITKRRAERAAGDVIGVRRVVNELDVKWPEETPSDIEIIKYVQNAVRRSPYLERREVRVHCRDAHVSIFGIVESNREKKIAGWLAHTAPGAVHVNNRLAVERQWKQKDDDEIEADLNRKLKSTLFNAANKIEVAVEDGVAILRGDVDTWRQWQAAMDLALEAGARHPHNLINVRYHPAHGASPTYIGF